MKNLKHQAGSYALVVWMWLCNVIVAHAGEAMGVVQWQQLSPLSVPVSGVVARIEVSPGQLVKRGDVMVVLDERPFALQLARAEARARQFGPARNEAQREFNRAEELFDRAVLSQVELDNAEIDFSRKDAQLDSALAEVEQARLELEYSVLKAPFDLVVVDIPVIKGQTIINRTQATPLVFVAAQGYAVKAAVKPGDGAGLETGLDVSVESGGKKYQGRIRQIDYNPQIGQQIFTITLNGEMDKAMTVGQSAFIRW